MAKHGGRKLANNLTLSAAVLLAAAGLAACNSGQPARSTGASPRTANLPGDPACSSTPMQFARNVLFPLVVQAVPSMSPTYVPIPGKFTVSVSCEGRWAVLQDFTIQAGDGNGIALFQLVGSSWQFVQLGDESREVGNDPCAQFPTAALKALGVELCG